MLVADGVGMAISRHFFGTTCMLLKYVFNTFLR